MRAPCCLLCPGAGCSEATTQAQHFFLCAEEQLKIFKKEVQHAQQGKRFRFLFVVGPHRVATLRQNHKCSADLCNTAMCKLHTGPFAACYALTWPAGLNEIKL